MHTDAVQAVGLLPIDVQELGVDLLSLSGHKFYGPKGVGALYVRNGVKLAKLLIGGAQERSMRGGTYNTPAIVGLGKAIELAMSRLSDVPQMRALRDYFTQRVMSEIPRTALNGAEGDHRLPNSANIAFDGVDGEALLQTLDRAGIAASSGSACASGTMEPSHVLLAMNVPEGFRNGSVRFTLGKDTTKEEIDFAVDTLVKEVARLRNITSLFAQNPSEKSDV